MADIINVKVLYMCVTEEYIMCQMFLKTPAIHKLLQINLSLTSWESM